MLESRRLVSGLRSLVLDDLGLSDALEQLLFDSKAQAGWLETTFQCDLEGKRFDPGLETAVYRVAQEALNNARKHAMAQRVRVCLKLEGDIAAGETLVLQVQDEGRGFDQASTQSQTGHFGLYGMAERIDLLGGRLRAQSAPGEGTRVEVRVAVLQAVPPSAELPEAALPSQAMLAQASQIEVD